MGYVLILDHFLYAVRIMEGSLLYGNRCPICYLGSIVFRYARLSSEEPRSQLPQCFWYNGQILGHKSSPG